MNPDFLNQSPREQMMERMGLQPHLMGLESHYGGGNKNSSGGGGNKKKKTLTPAQKRFKDREAKGLDGFTGLSKVSDSDRKKGITQLTQYRDHQKKQVQDAARARNDAYQAKKAGLDSQKLGAEATRLTGIPTKPVAGSFNISEAGKAQAEANRKEAAAKKAEATRKSTFDPNRLSFNMNSNPFTGQSFLAGGYNQPGKLGSWFDKGLNVRVPNEADASFSRLFKDDMSQLGKFTNKQGKVEGGLFNTGIPKNFRQLKQLFTGKGGLGFSFGSGIGTGPTPLGRQTVRRILPYASQISLGKDIFNYGGSKQLENFANNTIGKINPYAGTTDQSPELNAAAAARDRGSLLSIGGFKVPELGFSEFMGINTVDRTPKNVQMATTDSGGLNIGTKKETTKGDPTGRSIWSKGKGLVDFAFNDRTDLDNLGSGLFGKGIVTPQDVKSDIKTSIKKIGPMETLALGIENVRDYNRIKDADNKALAFAENVNADQFAKTLSFAEDSKAVQKAGENLGTFFNQKNVTLPSDFKAQIKNVVKGIQEETGGIEQGKVNNRFMMKNRVDEINNLLANVNQNPNLSTLSKIGGQFDPATNPNAANMTNLQKIAAGFDSKSPNALALSASDRGITGSGGNLLIGGKLSDIYRQATGNIEGGVNAGIPKGQVGLSNADMFNVATSAIKNIKTPGTLSAKQADSIQRTIEGGVTPSSLIKGVLPRFGRSSGGTPVSQVRSGGGIPSIAAQILQDQQQPVEELLPLPTNADLPNLQDMQQQAYNQQMSIYGAPNYMAQFQPVQRVRPLRRRQYFNRDYFTQFA